MDIISRARLFYLNNGHDIDRARFEYHFGQLPLDDLLDVLGRYQNEDGGFGHALEVDIAAPDSNPFATELALLICIQAGVPAEHPLLVNTVAYLEDTQDEDGGWRFIEAVYEHELAPWFLGWQWPNLNPACTISGLLQGARSWINEAASEVEHLFDQLAKPDDLISEEFYSVRPYAYYFLPVWEHPMREFYLSGLLWWLVRVHLADNIEDSGHFFEYVRGPFFYTGKRLPKEIISARLNKLTGEQAEDGGWPSPYNPLWRGWITVQNLLVLQAFDRI